MKLLLCCDKTLRALVYLLAVVSGLATLTMIVVTMADVLLRKTPWPIIGAYDIVEIAGGVAVAAALPYTTAVKGHVAIEFFYHKLARRGRLFFDVFLRLLSMTLFGFAAWKFIDYGQSLRTANQVSQTLQIPIFWLPWLFAFCFGVMVLVILHNMLHPGKEMIKP